MGSESCLYPRLGVQLLEGFPEYPEQSDEQVIQPLQSPTKPTLVYHAGNVLLFFQHGASQDLFTVEEQCRQQPSGHDFGVAHATLGVFFVMQPYP